jgi:hypothetical protein
MLKIDHGYSELSSILHESREEAIESMTAAGDSQLAKIGILLSLMGEDIEVVGDTICAEIEKLLFDLVPVQDELISQSVDPVRVKCHGRGVTF